MNEQAVTTDMQAQHPTQAYFVDPLNTPESQKAGIAVQFAHHVEIKDHEAMTPLVNVKTGKTEYKSPIDLFHEHVLLPGALAPDGTVAVIHQGKQIQVKPNSMMPKPPTMPTWRRCIISARTMRRRRIPPATPILRSPPALPMILR